MASLALNKGARCPRNNREMAVLRTEHIKEISSHVSEGVMVFGNKKTREIRAMIGLESEEKLERAKWKSAFDLMQADEKNWLLISKIPLDDEIFLRKGFIVEATDNQVKRQLTNALNRKDPIRNFHQVVEGDEILNQHWLNYRKGAYQKWVSDFIIAAYNY